MDRQLESTRSPDRRTAALYIAGAALPVAVSLALYGGLVGAADHAEAPGTQADLAADLADVYTWIDGDHLVLAMTFAGLQAPAEGQAATYDPNVLYTFKIDNNNDNIEDISIYIRFGQNEEGLWGLQVQNLPGSESEIIGPVEEIVYAGDGRYIYTGLREEPFFFDLEGFKTTVETSTLSFDNTRDEFAGKNCSSIVVEADLETALAGGSSLQIWATTGRVGG